MDKMGKSYRQEQLELLRESAEPWERQHDESAPAYAAFCVYRDMPPVKRTLRTVAALVGKNHALIERWSSGYKWTARVEMWDRWRDAEALAEVRKRHKDTAKLAAQVAAHPLTVVAQLLNGKPLVAQQLVEEYEREAARGHATQAYERLMRIAGASSSALAGLLTAERLANGLSSENMAVNVTAAAEFDGESDTYNPEEAAIIRGALLELSRMQERAAAAEAASDADPTGMEPVISG